MNKPHPNLTLLDHMVQELDQVADQITIVGGCAATLLITDPAATHPRPTIDVDILIEALVRSDYYKFCDQIRDLGFTEDQSKNTSICRWKKSKLLLDVMPTSPEILGFSNRWFDQAHQNTITVPLLGARRIEVIDAPHFLLTKIEAYYDRGNHDPLMSHDLEDIVSVINGRPELLDEITASNENVRINLAAALRDLLTTKGYVDSISAHLPGDISNQSRKPLVLRIIRAISTLA